MTTNSVVVGVDVAKDRLDVAVRPSGEAWSEANDDAGVRALVTRLRPLGPALIVCEATGGFVNAAGVYAGAQREFCQGRAPSASSAG
jgi:transposase